MLNALVTDHVLDLNDTNVTGPHPAHIIAALCIYYRETGKYYSSGCCLINTEHPDFIGCIHPREFGQRLRELNKLPGLSTGTWASFFTVQTDYTELVTPA